MRNNRLIFIFVILLTGSILLANTLKEYYHFNYGRVERMVFVFSDYPRYRLREDILSVNLSFLECGKTEQVQSSRVIDNPVISKVTIVPTDAFIGVLINTFNDYRVEHFVMKSGDDFKLVLDIFRHAIPLSAEESLEYADFYRSVNNSSQALYYQNLADSLLTAPTKQPDSPLIEDKQPEPENVIEPVNIPKESSPEPAVEKPQAPPKKVTPAKAEKKAAIGDQEAENDSWDWLPDRVKEILADIYHDKMLMFSIIVVFGVIFIMLLMALIRKLARKKLPEQKKPENSFGSLEFQRVTIKRLLANGWQVEEIAKELNLSPEQVEELGRGFS